MDIFSKIERILRNFKNFSKFFAKVARSLSVFKINLTWGGRHFAGRERLNLKNQKTEKNDPYQNQSNLHQNFYSEFLRKILHRLDRKRYFFENSRGTILIEFAFCIPIMILLLFFIHDILLLQRMHTQAQHSAYIAAQLLQNVSVNRTDRRLTKKDLKQITYASSINFFPGKTVFRPHPLGYFYEIYFKYVKRISENQYDYYEFCMSANPAFKEVSSPNTFREYTGGHLGKRISKNLTEIETISPKLVCSKDNGEKVHIRNDYYKVNSNVLFFFPWFAKSVSKTVILIPKSGIFPVR